MDRSDQLSGPRHLAFLDSYLVDLSGVSFSCIHAEYCKLCDEVLRSRPSFSIWGNDFAAQFSVHLQDRSQVDLQIV